MQTQKRSRRPAFTLVELLAVIAIIGLLIAILVPGVSAVKRSAKETQTKAIIGTLETGLQTFKGEQQVGGTFPPSHTDDPSNRLKVANPYNGFGGSTIEISGAGLLVWGLLGADSLGTPGFKAVDGDEYWADSTGNDDDGDLYYVDGKKGPAFTRYGPYVDLSKVKLSELVRDNNNNPQGYKIEAETRAGLGLRDYPMFLDSFGYPILYWKADGAGKALAENEWDGTRTARGIYHYSDNEEVISAAGMNHRLKWGGYDPSSPGNDPEEGILSDGHFYTYFAYYIWNQDVAAKPTPLRPDSYILISAGADGMYGTADDIDNFSHNGHGK